MSLVSVHGVATRPSSEYDAMVAQRGEHFRSLASQDADIAILNRLWGSLGTQK